ncbi:MAG: hypothetical protein ACOH1Y_05345 [Propionicimonas sp.]
MNQRPAVTKARKTLAAILMAATLATGGVAFALSEAAATAATSTTDTTTATSGFGSTGSVSSTSRSAHTTTSGS